MEYPRLGRHTRVPGLFYDGAVYKGDPNEGLRETSKHPSTMDIVQLVGWYMPISMGRSIS
jgi:hypothetical protein